MATTAYSPNGGLEALGLRGAVQQYCQSLTEPEMEITITWGGGPDRRYFGTLFKEGVPRRFPVTSGNGAYYYTSGTFIYFYSLSTMGMVTSTLKIGANWGADKGIGMFGDTAAYSAQGFSLTPAFCVDGNTAAGDWGFLFRHAWAWERGFYLIYPPTTAAPDPPYSNSPTDFSVSPWALRTTAAGWNSRKALAIIAKDQNATWADDGDVKRFWSSNNIESLYDYSVGIDGGFTPGLAGDIEDVFGKYDSTLHAGSITLSDGATIVWEPVDESDPLWDKSEDPPSDTP
jgi:hypothetical protein